MVTGQARRRQRGPSAARAQAGLRSAKSPSGNMVSMSDYTAIVKQSGEWWIGWIEEVPGVNCQERTREELIETLRSTLIEALELNREEARRAAGQEFEEASIAV